MKYFIKVAIVAYIFAGCIAKHEDPVHKVQSVSVSALLDVTDTKLYWPSSNQLLALLHCDKYPEAQFSFKLSAISNKVQNQQFIRTLDETTENEFSLGIVEKQQRAESILRLYDQVRKGVNEFYTHNDTTKAMSQSVCGQTIMNELQYLASKENDKSILVVCSDLREHRDIDMYGVDTLNTANIVAWLTRLNPNMPSLRGIAVMFVFMPKNAEEDKAFNSIAQVYKAYLEQKGATVNIQANLL